MTAREIIQAKSTRTGFGHALRRFASNCSGATAIEYGLLLALIGGAIIAGMSLLGMADLFGRISTALSS